jgi:hypothetical protein
MRDGINLTAAQIGGPVTGSIDAKGCHIGVYFGPGSVESVTGVTIENASYFGIVNNGGDITISNATVRNIGDVPFTGNQHGNAILFASDSLEPSTGSIRASTITDYQKGGIVVNGPFASATFLITWSLAWVRLRSSLRTGSR